VAFKGKKKSNEEKMKEIEDLTNGMAEQIDSYFISEKALREHLAFMANFHNYSVRNMALIDKQFLGATAVGSFNFWKSKGAAVQKGEKGIKILVPTPVQFYKKDGKEIPLSAATKQDKELISSNQLPTSKKLFFKVGHVFEYTQTNARELNLSVSEIFGSYHKDGVLENQTEMIAAMHKVAAGLDFTILKEPPFELGTAKGAAFPYEKAIALNPRNTDYENVTTLIHELAHAKLHGPEKRDALTTSEKEFQAEMVSYVVAHHYGIDTKDFTLAYLGSWTQGTDLKDKERLLNEVRSTASEFIGEIGAHFDQVKEREQLLEKNMPGQELLKGNVSEPLMYVQGISKDFQPFGEANNIDFDQLDLKRIAYTVALPRAEKEAAELISGSYEKGEYIHPLHQLDKAGLVDKETVNTLETHYHNELQKQDDEYIKGFASRMRAEIYREDAAIEKKMAPHKTTNLELER
jgi:hypothetical protein